jgi:polyphosphate kinase
MGKDKNGKPEKQGKAARMFEIDNPDLPVWIEDAALASGGYPYGEKLKRKDYEELLAPLQVELVKLQSHMAKTGDRFVVIFEGRDSAGKGGCIASILEHINPRHARAIALAKPTDGQRGQWYFQRYVEHLPTRGDMVLFDRSWYNRAGVERVMGFCTPEQHADFLRDAPVFESLLVRDGFRFIKFYLTVGREMQLKRFHERRHEPLKQWKLTDIDLKAIGMWDEYSRAEAEMFRFTHTADCPWTVVHANDQRRARLECIKVILGVLDYAGKDKKVAGAPDRKLTGLGPDHIKKTDGA